jgi:hypothetical protein
MLEVSLRSGEKLLGYAVVIGVRVVHFDNCIAIET